MSLDRITASGDPFQLSRFVSAQKDVYASALAEIQSGQKRTHWMWFIFPQIDGLGSSPMARQYAIKSLEEARQYLAHPVLGPRLNEVAGALLAKHGRSALEIFGSPDDLKLRSSLTLFAQVAGAGSLFEQVLSQYFPGAPDPRTLQILKALA